jgi:hypothetical protein
MLTATSQHLSAIDNPWTLSSVTKADSHYYYYDQLAWRGKLAAALAAIKRRLHSRSGLPALLVPK